MKNKLVLGTVAGLAVAVGLSFTAVAVNAQSAQAQARNNSSYGLHNGTGSGQQGNGYNSSLESRAKVLGMSVDELKTALQTKTMLQVAQEKGLTEDQLQVKMRETATVRWQDRGLSTAQIQERTAAQTERQSSCDGTADHDGQGGPKNGQRTE